MTTEPSTTTQKQELKPQPTQRPWAVHPRWPNYVVPASDAAKLIGGADDEIMDREQFATPICDTRGNELSRFAHDKERVAQHVANAELIVAAVNAYSAPSDTEQRLREALEEIERLKQHIADLNHDFESAIKHCDEHHVEVGT